VSNWPHIATFFEADLTPFRFSFNKLVVKVDDEDGSEGEEETTQINSVKRVKRSRNQDLSKVTHLERAFDEPFLSTSAAANASSASSTTSAMTLSSLDGVRLIFICSPEFITYTTIVVNIEEKV
jgi:hypothetical protein